MAYQGSYDGWFNELCPKNVSTSLTCPLSEGVRTTTNSASLVAGDTLVSAVITF